MMLPVCRVMIIVQMISCPRPELWKASAMAMLRLLLMLLSAATTCCSGGQDPQGWFVDPITVKVTHERRVPFPSSAQAVDLAAQRGECERAQIWGWNDQADLTDVRVIFSDLKSSAGGTLAKSEWSYTQQGYVNVSTTTRYTCLEDLLTGKTPPPPPPPPPHTNCDDTPFGACWTGCPNVQKNWSDPHSCSGKPNGHSCNQCVCNTHNTSCHSDNDAPGHACLPGWYPDPLLDIPASGIPLIQKGFTQPIVLELCIPYGQAAGNFSGTMTVTAKSEGTLFTVPVSVEVRILLLLMTLLAC